MKKIILIMFFVSSSLFAQLNWMNNVYDAYERAEKEKKMVFVIISLKGCSSCAYMYDVVFKNQNVIKALEKDFVAVHLDILEDFVPLELEHFVTPTLYFLDSNEKVLHRINGYKNEKDFLDTLEMMVD